MSHRREIENHRRKLNEIRDIMDSMKTLAYMETHKLTRFIDAQNKLTNNIEEIADDFLHFHPDVLPRVDTLRNIIVAIGSQRGFCGGFNEVILEHLQATIDTQKPDNTTLIAVGQKLHNHIEELPFERFFIEGANVTEEISNTVSQIAQTLSASKKTLFTLSVLHHTTEGNSIVSERLLPPFAQQKRTALGLNLPPVLNLSPDSFLLELTDHYLFAALHRTLYASLMAENMQRVQHLENAVNHLDDKTDKLALKANALRQEEIIEEIEVILLNASVT